MPHPNLFLTFEVMGFLAFVLILARELYQKNMLRAFEIICCAVFGMVLEFMDIYFGQAYSYSPAFYAKIANVPLAIGFGWASIVYCTMLLSDQYNIPWKLRPFMDALTAVILDLGIDAVAIRLGFWKWAIPLNQEFFGVPFENLIGWILVVLSFSFFIRFIRTLNPKRILTKILMLLSPMVAYLMLFIGILVMGMIIFLPYRIDNWSKGISTGIRPDLTVLYNPQVQIWKAAVFMIILVELVNIVVWAIIKYRRKYLWRFDLLSFSVMLGLHLFFFAAIFLMGLGSKTPMLIVIGASSILIYCLLHFLPYLMRPGVVYIFRDIEKVIQKEEKAVEKVIQASFK